MATDPFLREVDEEYRRDQIARVWRRFGPAIVVVAVLTIAAIGGWRYWQHAEITRAEQAALRYDDAVQLARDGKGEESERALAAMTRDGPAAYRLLARFRQAAEAGQRDPEAGARLFDAAASDTEVEAPLRELARFRAATLRLGQEGAPGTAATAELERLAVPANAWRHVAREMLGLAALKRGDGDAAGRWFDQIAQDRDTPQGLRARLEIYTALAAGGPVASTQ